MAKDRNAPVDVPVPKIPMDVLRTWAEMRTPIDWLVIFCSTCPDTYSSAPHPASFDTWRLQLERILEVSKVLHSLWVPFATIQLEGEALRWWSNLEVDPYTTSWSSFTSTLCDAFEMPPDQHVPEFDLEEDLEEEHLEED